MFEYTSPKWSCGNTEYVCQGQHWYVISDSAKNTWMSLLLLLPSQCVSVGQEGGSSVVVISIMELPADYRVHRTLIKQVGQL